MKIDIKFGNHEGPVSSRGHFVFNKLGIVLQVPETKNTYGFIASISFYTGATTNELQFNPGLMICGLHPKAWANAICCRRTMPGSRRTYRIG